MLVVLHILWTGGATPVAAFPLPPPTDTICKGDTVQLTASNPLALSYSWTPNYHITSTTIANPKVFPDTTTTYYVTVNGITSNLIVNGNFSMGNVGFTSAYTYTTNLWPEATYCVGTNPQTFHSNFSPCGDHTTGNGNMMVVNASGTPNVIVWQQTVPVVPGANYVFSCWLASVHASSPAQLQFFVNGVQIGPVFAATSTTCNWNMFYNTWSSGTATSAVISIRNQNISLSGNDFAIDDLYFAQLLQLTDSTKIVVENPKVNLGNDTAICPYDSIQLDAGAGFAQYLWSNGASVSSVPVNNAGSYWVKVTTANGCKAADTMQVAQLTLPQILTLNDSVCPGDSALISASCPTAASYLWSNGTSGPLNLVSPAATSTYQVIVTDSMGCLDTSSATAVIHPVPQVQISNDTAVCLGNFATLTASGGQQYLWSPTGDTTPVIFVSPSTPSETYKVTVFNQFMCCDSAEVTVNTVPYPSIIMSLDADTICRGEVTLISASGGSTYQWSNGAVTPSIQVNPSENTLYQVTVTNTGNGISCSSDSSIEQLVKNCNIFFIPNAISLSGVNRIFKPVGENLYADFYKLAIYNRFGQLLFETSDFNVGWNGTFKDEYVPEGVYVYDLMVTTRPGETFRRQGTVTVIR
jgi:gliding motility-associated-like protein